MMASMMAMFPVDPNGPPEMRKSLEGLKGALEKYVPADAAAAELNLGGSPEELRAAVRKNGKAIKDRAGFVAAVFKSMMESGVLEKGQGPLVGAKLVDLTRTGSDSGTATASVGLMDPQPMPMVFRMAGGKWKIDSIGSYGVQQIQEAPPGKAGAMRPIDGGTPSAVPIASAPVGTAPVGTAPIGTVPIGTVPIGTVPPAAVPPAATPPTATAPAANPPKAKVSRAGNPPAATPPPASGPAPGCRWRSRRLISASRRAAARCRTRLRLPTPATNR